MGKKFRIEGGIDEVKLAEKSATERRDIEKLQVIRMGMSGNYTMEEVAEVVGRARSAVGRWANWYRKDGIGVCWNARSRRATSRR